MDDDGRVVLKSLVFGDGRNSMNGLNGLKFKRKSELSKSI